MDGFCLQCGQGARASDDGKSCENVVPCGPKQVVGYNGSCFDCYPGYKANDDNSQCIEDNDPEPVIVQPDMNDPMEDYNNLRCNISQVKALRGGKWICEYCPQYTYAHDQEECMSESCTTSQILGTNGRCMSCSAGYIASTDGRRCV